MPSAGVTLLVHLINAGSDILFRTPFLMCRINSSARVPLTFLHVRRVVYARLVFGNATFLVLLWSINWGNLHQCSQQPTIKFLKRSFNFKIT
jgi:hypothetical protein